MSNVPPGLILAVAALVIAVLPNRFRPIAFVIAGALTLAQMVVVLTSGTVWSVEWLGFEVTPLRVDRLSLLFGYVFGILAFAGGIFAIYLKDKAQQVAALLYGGGALGVVFAGDLLTLVVGWELMAVASVVLVLNGGRTGSKAAALRYMFVHIVGGSILLVGVLWHVGQGGGLAFNAFHGTTAAWLILGGVGINSAFIPLHAWLSDAYPEASVTGAVFLGGFTTKTAVYVLARGFPEWEILVWVGMIMAIYGVAYALVQNDVRRVLAYDIVSQVGFMVVAVGIGGTSGTNAAAAHAFSHVLYNGLLFMAAGALIYTTGRSTLTALGGAGRVLPWVLALYMVGAFSVSSLPGFNAFVTKGLILHTVEDAGLTWVVFTLYVVSVGTFLAVGLRVPYILLRGRASERLTQAVPDSMYVAMGAIAVLCVGIGMYPGILLDLLPFEDHANPSSAGYLVYTPSNIVHALQLFGFAALGFWLFRARFHPSDRSVVDVDWVYRKAGKPIRIFVQEPLEFLFSSAGGILGRVYSAAVRSSTAPDGAAMKIATARPALGVAIGLVALVLGILVALVAAG